MAPPTAAFLVVACAASAALAEVYHFNGEAAPPGGTLEGRYLFYVHSSKDSPGAKSFQPQVTFKDIRPRKENGGAVKDAMVAVGILPWSDQSALLDPEKVCGLAGETFTPQFKDHASKQHAHWHLVASPPADDASYTLEKSGPYLLVIANCATVTTTPAEKVLIHGSIAIRNPYGYAAGNEYFKSSVYGLAFSAYTVALFIWGAKLFIFTKSSDARRAFHHLLTIVASMGILECALSLALYVQANKTEVSREDSVVIMLAQGAGVAKMGYFLLVFRDVAVEDESCKAKVIQTAVMLLYIVAATFKVSVGSLRQTYSVTDSTWMSCMAFAALAAAFALVWVMRGLARTMQMCREASDDKMLALYQHTTLLALFLAIASAVIAGAQYLDLPGQAFTSWYYHTLVEDAAPQAISLGAILLMMFMWRPSEDLRPKYNMAAGDGEVIGLKDGDDAEAAATVEPAGPVQFVLDDDDDDHATRNGATAKTVGLSHEAREVRAAE